MDRLRAAGDRLTVPHASVTATADRRRARLAAGMLLLMIPLGAIFASVYALPVFRGDGELQDGLSLGVLAAFVVAYALVRGPMYRLGIVLAILAPLVAVLASLPASSEPAQLLYFTAVPVLLASLLLDIRIAAALGLLNIVGAYIVVGRAPEVHPGDLLSAFLFLLAVTPVGLLGAGFLDRSIRDAEQANQRLQDAEGYRLRLLNTIVHDMAAPLTPLRLQMAMLDETSKGAGVMRRNVALLERLINDVADLAKIEADKLTLDLQPADLGALAAQATQALEGQASTRGVLVDVQAQPAPVRVDVDRLTQVFYNLLTNAIKFTPAGGSVSVQVRHRTSEVEARVQDNGRGLVPDEISRLFQPFSQVHERGESAERGTGLGLFISKAIVEAHGGRVWVHSDGHGTGSTFAFALPAG